MSVILNTKRALERRLKTAFPAVKIAYPGVAFTAPTEELYMRLQYIVQRPDDPVIGDRYYRERITFQVFIMDVIGKGSANAIAKAEQVRDLFYKGWDTLEQDSKIYVLRTPQISNEVITSDRLVVPVFIEVVTEVYKD